MSYQTNDPETFNQELARVKAIPAEDRTPEEAEWLRVQIEGGFGDGYLHHKDPSVNGKSMPPDDDSADLEPDGLPSEQEVVANAQLEAFVAAPLNPKNQLLQPVPLNVLDDVMESTEGPMAVMTFMHPSGEFTLMMSDPTGFDQLVQQITGLKDKLVKAQMRHALLHPNGAQIVVPVPKMPGANGAHLLG